MSEPRTKAGADAVRMRGLFGGETEARTTGWVRRIEDEMLDKVVRVVSDALGREANDDENPIAVRAWLDEGGRAAVLAAIERIRRDDDGR